MNTDNIIDKVDQNKKEWVENFARIGIAAKGVVYCLIGFLAFMAAFGMGNNNDTDKRGAFSLILEQPFGKVLLGLVAVGLLGYVAWRFIEAIKDPENKGSDAKGIAVRIGYAFSGIIYLALAYFALTLVFRGLPAGSGNSNGGGNSSSNATLVEKLLEQPFGQWLVGAVAIGIILKGLYQFYRAFSGKYKKKINDSSLDPKKKEIGQKAGLIGYIARGVVLCIIGYFFIQAALQSDPSEAKGTSGALSFIEQSAYGTWLLALVAVGLIGYGVFMFVKAHYREMVLLD